MGVREYRCAHAGSRQVFACCYTHGRVDVVDVDAFVLAAVCACTATHVCWLGRASLFVCSIVYVPQRIPVELHGDMQVHT